VRLLVTDFMLQSGLAQSRRDAERQIRAGAVRLGFTSIYDEPGIVFCEKYRGCSIVEELDPLTDIFAEFEPHATWYLFVGKRGVRRTTEPVPAQRESILCLQVSIRGAFFGGWHEHGIHYAEIKP
jgi:hypothetical protein